MDDKSHDQFEKPANAKTTFARLPSLVRGKGKRKRNVTTRVVGRFKN